MSDWKRVSRDQPCRVCGRPDWCLYTGPEGDPVAAICPRVESPKRCGDAGWLHRLREGTPQGSRRLVRRIALGSGHRRDLGDLVGAYQLGLSPERLRRFAEPLGLDDDALRRFGVGWSSWHGAWAFPMRDAHGAVIGVHLRRPDGQKLSVKGSRQGLFIPGMPSAAAGRLLLAEGLTDAVALLQMGLALVVGRPSCSSGLRLIVDLLKRLVPSTVVIVADNDEPGRRGADGLASALVAYAPAVQVIAPPSGFKDAREWLRAGAALQDLERTIAAAPARRLTIRRALALKG